MLQHQQINNMPSTFTSVTGELIPTDKIEYRISGTHIKQNGYTLEVTAGDYQGTFVETVDIYVDGKKIGTQKVQINVQQTADAIINKATDVTMSLDKVDDWNSNANFKDLYYNDKTIILYGKMDTRWRDWDSYFSVIKNDFLELGNQVVSVLTSAGLNETQLRNAVKTVVDSYMNAGPVKNVDDDGTDQGDLTNNCLSYMDRNRESTKSKVVWTVDEDGKDSNIYMIHFKDFVDDIIAEYQKAVS